jgi:hypothetical protein
MPPSQASAEESQDSTMLLVAIIAGVVCCLLIVGVIAVLVLKNKKRDDDNGDPYTVAITRNDIDDGTYSSHVVCCVSTPHTHSHNYLSGGSLKSATDYPGTTFNSSASEPYGHLPSSVASSDYDAVGLALAGGAQQADDNYGIMPSLGAGECTIFSFLVVYTCARLLCMYLILSSLSKMTILQLALILSVNMSILEVAGMQTKLVLTKNFVLQIYKTYFFTHSHT